MGFLAGFGGLAFEGLAFRIGFFGGVVAMILPVLASMMKAVPLGCFWISLWRDLSKLFRGVILVLGLGWSWTKLSAYAQGLSKAPTQSDKTRGLKKVAFIFKIPFKWRLICYNFIIF